MGPECLGCEKACTLTFILSSVAQPKVEPSQTVIEPRAFSSLSNQADFSSIVRLLSGFGRRAYSRFYRICESISSVFIPPSQRAWRQEYGHLPMCIKLQVNVLLQSGKPLREKTFANFVVLWLNAKVFSAKLGAWHPLARKKRAVHKSFFRENCIFHKIAKVFSLENFQLYGSFKSQQNSICLLIFLTSIQKKNNKKKNSSFSHRLLQNSELKFILI